jgi:transposase-like protein
MRKMVRRRSEETWRELVVRQAGSGLSVPAFCRQERLNAHTFYGWRSKLCARTAVKADAGVSGSEASAPSAGFIDLGSLGSGSSRFEIRLDLGGGVVLHVARG